MKPRPTPYRLEPITTWTEHQQALAEIDRLWGAPAGTARAELLDALVALVDRFEDLHVPLGRAARG